MTYIEFRDKYNGQFLDFDGSYGSQCWDLVQYYNTEVIDVPSWVFSGCGLVSNMLYPPKRNDLDKYFDEVDTHAMIQGDVCIWEEGHVAIYDHYNPDDNNCYYFSQNPNPCQVMPINMKGHHAFRRKSTKEELAKPVERDKNKNQIEVVVTNLRVRACGSLQGTILGIAQMGIYDYYEVVENDGYTWYRITDDDRRQWIASSPEWTIIYPKKEDEYVSFKVEEDKDGYKKINLGEVYIK